MIKVRVHYNQLFRVMAGRKKEEVVALDQATVEGLVKAMEESYGRRFTRTLRDPHDELNSGVTVLVNGEAFSGWDAPLADDDQIAFLFYAVGG